MTLQPGFEKRQDHEPGVKKNEERTWQSRTLASAVFNHNRPPLLVPVALRRADPLLCENLCERITSSSERKPRHIAEAA